MKYKPEVPNELILDNVLTIEYEDPGQKVRVCLLYGEMIQITVHEPTDDEVKHIQLLLTQEQVEAIIKLYQEWKD